MEDKCLSSNILRLRLECGLTQEQVAKKAEISLLTYGKIELGTANPTQSTLQKLTKEVFNVDFSELYRPVAMPLKVRFRALKNKTVKKRGEIIYNAEEWLKSFNHISDKLSEPTVYGLQPLENKTKNPKEMAEAVREFLGIGDDPIKDICALLEEKAGIKICSKSYSTDGFFGLSASENSDSKVIVVNTWDRITVERRIFTAAHELGHILLHLNSFDSDSKEENEQEEKEADTFASYFLMPENEFTKEWNAIQNCDLIDRVIKVKKTFKVSYKTVLYRMQDYFGGKIWGVFKKEYKKKYPNSNIGPKDEIDGLKEFHSLSNEFQGSRKVSYLIKKALDKKIISDNEALKLLNVDKDKFNEIKTSWNYEIPVS